MYIVYTNADLQRSDAGVGARWNNLRLPVTVDDNITMSHILLMLLLDSVIYLLIMWYKEAVFPGSYGIPQPPYFFVMVSAYLLIKVHTVHSL